MNQLSAIHETARGAAQATSEQIEAMRLVIRAHLQPAIDIVSPHFERPEKTPIDRIKEYPLGPGGRQQQRNLRLGETVAGLAYTLLHPIEWAKSVTQRQD